MCRRHHIFYHSSNKHFNGRGLFIQLLKESFPEKYHALLEEKQEYRQLCVERISKHFYLEAIERLKNKLLIIQQ